VRIFLRKLLLYLFILVIFLLLSVFLYRHFANFKLKKEASILLLGHSHPECAYNDSLIPNFANMAQSGESYFYTYLKARYLIKQNPTISTVLIELSNNQIHSEMDDWIWSEKFMSYRFPCYAQAMDKEELDFLWQKNPECFMKSIQPLLRRALKSLFTAYAPNSEIGGYLPLRRNKTDSLLKQSATEAIDQKDWQQISDYNLIYLRKLVDFLLRENKKVILIRSPLHSSYPGYANELNFQNILQQYFPDLEFMDFSKFPLSNQEFGDLEHLNYTGATRYSIWFSNLLESGLIYKENKKCYVDAMAKLADED